MIISSAAATIGAVVVAFFVFAFIVIFLKSCLKVVQQGCVGVVKRFGEFRSIKQPGLHVLMPLADRMDKVDIRELKLNTALAAVTVWGIADKAEPLGKRQSRSELEALMKETGLDKQLQGLGLWPAFQSGERGRQR